ncbi:hypothetical protein HanRHA438_Chr14g0634801 [Helianthus annuus]|nr:hypothetical protein HanRHA438_Chr14g0634801 [Helianthus annuus]
MLCFVFHPDLGPTLRSPAHFSHEDIKITCHVVFCYILLYQYVQTLPPIFPDRTIQQQNPPSKLAYWLSCDLVSWLVIL